MFPIVKIKEQKCQKLSPALFVFSRVESRRLPRDTGATVILYPVFYSQILHIYDMSIPTYLSYYNPVFYSITTNSKRTEMYLRDRRPVAFTHNPGLSFVDDPRPEFNRYLQYKSIKKTQMNIFFQDLFFYIIKQCTFFL